MTRLLRAFECVAPFVPLILITLIVAGVFLATYLDDQQLLKRPPTCCECPP